MGGNGRAVESAAEVEVSFSGVTTERAAERGVIILRRRLAKRVEAWGSGSRSTTWRGLLSGA